VRVLARAAQPSLHLSTLWSRLVPAGESELLETRRRAQNPLCLCAGPLREVPVRRTPV